MAGFALLLFARKVGAKADTFAAALDAFGFKLVANQAGAVVKLGVQVGAEFGVVGLNGAETEAEYKP